MTLAGLLEAWWWNCSDGTSALENLRPSGGGGKGGWVWQKPLEEGCVSSLAVLGLG